MNDLGSVARDESPKCATSQLNGIDYPPRSEVRWTARFWVVGSGPGPLPHKPKASGDTIHAKRMYSPQPVNRAPMERGIAPEHEWM